MTKNFHIFGKDFNTKKSQKNSKKYFFVFFLSYFFMENIQIRSKTRFIKKSTSSDDF